MTSPTFIEASARRAYAPMERRIEKLRTTYAGDPEALAALDEVAHERAIHHRHSAYYAYEAFVARR